MSADYTGAAVTNLYLSSQDTPAVGANGTYVRLCDNELAPGIFGTVSQLRTLAEALHLAADRQESGQLAAESRVLP